MEALSKVQKFFNDNQIQVLVGLLAVVFIIVVVWFTMFRSQVTSPVLENKARVDEATTAPTEQLPTQEQLEEMARYREQMESQQAQPDNTVSE